MRTAAHYIPFETTAAYNLAVVLATFLNNNSANGIVNPKWDRLMYLTGMDSDTLSRAVDELVRSEWFAVVRSPEGEVEQFKFLCMDWMVENSNQLSKHRSSLNHAKFNARYMRMSDQNALAIQGMATESIVPVFDDLGFNHYKKTLGGVPPHQIDNGGYLAKVCHSCFFWHPKLQSPNPEVWAELFAMKTLPEDWTVDPFDCVLSLAEILAKFPSLTPEDIHDAVDAINDAGWWFAETGTTDEGDAIRMTPTHKLHAAVWDLDNHAGGKNTTQWEVDHGFTFSAYRKNAAGDPSYQRMIAGRGAMDDGVSASRTGEPDAFLDPPPLGYHYIYALSSAKMREYLIVGETTQPLTQRKNQHYYTATNQDANDRIVAIATDPDDYLKVEHLATVHYSICNDQEMGALQAMLALGHDMKNKIVSRRDNYKTIKPDKRLPQVQRYGLSREEQERQKELQKAALQKCLDDHGGEKVLFKVTELPPVPPHVLEAKARAEQLAVVAAQRKPVFESVSWGDWQSDDDLIPWEVGKPVTVSAPPVSVVVEEPVSIAEPAVVPEPVVAEPVAEPKPVVTLRESVPAPYSDHRQFRSGGLVPPAKAVPLEVSRKSDAVPYPDIWQPAAKDW